MKRFLLVLLPAAGLGLLSIAVRAPEPSYAPPALATAPEPVPLEITSTPPSGHRLVRFDVEGMCCEGCAFKLHGVLSSVEGVREAAVDSVLGRAEALVPEGLDPALLAAALTQGPYRAVPREP